MEELTKYVGGGLYSVHVSPLDNGPALHVQGLFHQYLPLAQLDRQNMEYKTYFHHGIQNLQHPG